MGENEIQGEEIPEPGAKEGQSARASFYHRGRADSHSCRVSSQESWTLVHRRSERCQESQRAEDQAAGAPGDYRQLWPSRQAEVMVSPVWAHAKVDVALDLV